jgi:hypothetical protein
MFRQHVRNADTHAHAFASAQGNPDGNAFCHADTHARTDTYT